MSRTSLIRVSWVQHNKMRELRAEVYRLQKSLEDHKGQASNMKNQYADWNKKLQDKLRDLRTEKNSWSAEAIAMRAADKEAKVRILLLLFSCDHPSDG